MCSRGLWVYHRSLHWRRNRNIGASHQIRLRQRFADSIMASAWKAAIRNKADDFLKNNNWQTISETKGVFSWTGNVCHASKVLLLSTSGPRFTLADSWKLDNNNRMPIYFTLSCRKEFHCRRPFNTQLLPGKLLAKVF